MVVTAHIVAETGSELIILLTNISVFANNKVMEEPQSPIQLPGEQPPTDQKPLPQPKIRKYALIFGIIALLGVIAIAIIAFMLNQPVQNTQSTNQQPDSQTPQNQERIVWQPQEDGTWKVSGGTEPECRDPIFIQSPTDVSKATAILYPGQTRGGNYKAHGGFRFDGTASDAVTVKMPFAGTIYRGSQYIEQGETQYLFDVINPCGYMIRFDHLRVLGDAFKAAAAKLPAPTESSRTENITTDITLKAGDIVATAVGFPKTNNIAFDFGVYDLRQLNQASESAAYRQVHDIGKELSWHAVCWFDMLPSADAAKVKALPAGDQASGKTSDYCK